MKKVILLMMVFVSMLSAVSAKEFNEPRWQTVFSDETETFKLDVNTVSYNEDLDTADVWIAKMNIHEPRQEVVHYIVYFGSTKVKVVDALLYTPDSNVVVGRRNLGYYVNADAGEEVKAVLDTVKQLVDRDTKKAAYDKKEREEMWANWKQRWEEEERRLQEEVNSPVLTIKRTVESQ